MRKMLATIAVFSIAASSLFFGNLEKAQADVITEEECYPAVLLIRGSGEGVKPDIVYSKNGIDLIKTNGHEGRKLGQLLTEFVNNTDPATTTSKTRFIGIDYPALDVFPTDTQAYNAGNLKAKGVAIATHIMNYQDSYNAGAEKVLEVIRSDEARGCNTQYMLVGYSQGAISARLAVDLLDGNTDKIVSTYLVGDPINDGSRELNEKQVSPAHAKHDQNGIMREGLTTIRNIQLAHLSIGGAHRTKKYLDTLTDPDPIIYKDDLASGYYSRVICHDGDIVCDADLSSSISSHVNYYEGSDAMGQVDLIHEIPAFDRQVEILASTASSNPRARTFKKTPSISSSSTIYNVANARPDDKCSWDEDNDETYEVINIPCASYEYKNTKPVEKMRVKVTDSSNIDYFFQLEDEVLQVDQIEHITKLDPNGWYQFKVKKMPPTDGTSSTGWCIGWEGQDPSRVIDDFDWTANMVGCRKNLSSQNAFDGMQVFQPRTEGLISGYDDNYELKKDKASPYWDWLTHGPATSKEAAFRPVLEEVIDNKLYYSLTNGEKCITAVKPQLYQYLALEDCKRTDGQLFTAEKLDGEYGGLSYERDTSAPTPPNVFLEINSYGDGTLKWSESLDRGLETSYKVYKHNLGNAHFEDLGEYSNIERYMSVNTTSMSNTDTYTYGVTAIDVKNQESLPYMISFTKPPAIAKPSKPSLLSSDILGNSVTLKLPSYNTNKARGVSIYDGEKYLGTYTGSSAVLATIPKTVYNFSYRLELADNVYSVESAKLKVTTGGS